MNVCRIQLLPTRDAWIRFHTKWKLFVSGKTAWKVVRNTNGLDLENNDFEVPSAAWGWGRALGEASELGD